MGDKGGEGVQKNPKISVTSFMDGPNVTLCCSGLRIHSLDTGVHDPGYPEYNQLLKSLSPTPCSLKLNMCTIEVSHVRVCMYLGWAVTCELYDT